MAESRKLYCLFNAIYAECKQEIHEINYSNKNIESSALSIDPEAYMEHFNAIPETEEDHSRSEKGSDSIMKEDLIGKEEMETEEEQLETLEPEIEKTEIAKTEIETTEIETTEIGTEDEQLKAEVVQIPNESDDIIKNEMKGMKQMTAATCATGLNANCGECCAIFSNEQRRAAFGYELERIECECHDICVEDVRDICVQTRTVTQTVPCNPDGSAGCRGGFLPDGVPAIQSFRVLCAEERLSPATGCDRIINEVEFEVVLRYGTGTLAVVTPRDTFDCRFFEFARFPSGERFPNTTAGLNQFRNELALIDGSCKVIIIENVSVVTEGNNCVLRITYRAIDKLWKHENLLVSALKPYEQNITVKQEFGQGHGVGPCTNNTAE
jgi:hypothetical protein